MSTTKELITKLKEFSGGLNWLDDNPAPNEFKTIRNWENFGHFLAPRQGIDSVYTSTNQRHYYGNNRYRALAGDEYSVCINSDGNPQAFKMLGDSASTAATHTPNEILDLDENSVAVSSGYKNEEITHIQRNNMVYAFIGTGYNSQNLVYEYDVTTTSDFIVRNMGIVAPQLKGISSATSGSVGGTISYTVRVLYTFAREDDDGNILSESGANVASTNTVTNYTEVTGGDATFGDGGFVFSIPATTSDPQVNKVRLYRTKNLNNASNDSSLYYFMGDLNVTESVTTAGEYVCTETYRERRTDARLEEQSKMQLLSPMEQYHEPLPASKHACFAGNRIWCTDGRTLYYTNTNPAKLETYNVAGYDVDSEGVYDPYTSSGFMQGDKDDGSEIRHLFEMNGNVVIVKDSKTGIILNSDPQNQIKWTDTATGSCYKHSFAMTPWGMMALTNKGFRIFDGYFWGKTDIGEKVVKQIDDWSKRVLPKVGVNTDYGYARAYFHKGKYNIRLEGQDDSGGLNDVGLCFDPVNGWSETTLDWESVLVYDNDAKAMGFNSDAADPKEKVYTLYTSDTDDGTDIEGIIQHGDIMTDADALEFKDAEIMAKMSSAASYFVKMPDGLHCAVTDVAPNPVDNEFNRKYRALLAGYTSSPIFSVKMKGNIKKGDIYRGQTIRLSKLNDYAENSRFTTGLIGRYNCDNLVSSVTLEDSCGGGIDLTFTGYVTASLRDDLTFAIARGKCIYISNPSLETCGFVNATGFDLAPEGEWTFATRCRSGATSATMTLFGNSKNGRTIRLVWYDADDHVEIWVGNSLAKTYGTSALITMGQSLNVFVTYKYLKGQYGGTGADALDFKSKIYIGSPTINDYTAAATTAVTQSFTGTRMFYGVAANHSWYFDEARVYDRALSEEEVKGLNAEFYNSYNSGYIDPQFY